MTSPGWSTVSTHHWQDFLRMRNSLAADKLSSQNATANVTERMMEENFPLQEELKVVVAFLWWKVQDIAAA